MQTIFLWNGRPVAFLHSGNLFARDGMYLGWVEPDETVWTAEGNYVGRLLFSRFVGRSTLHAPPENRSPRRACLAPASLPQTPPPAIPLPALYGWVDGFELCFPPLETRISGVASPVFGRVS